jgi:hypothetical protein
MMVANLATAFSAMRVFFAAELRARRSPSWFVMLAQRTVAAIH